jgi:Ca2+-transporting ATPase
MQSPLINILLFALAVNTGIWAFRGEDSWPVETFAIAVILILNAGLGVYQEGKAEAALARLKALAGSMVWVSRDGQLQRLPATELVPGDVIRSDIGDRIPADGTLLEGQGIMVDESILTGESVPVDKAANEEIFGGTLFVRGTGYIELTRTGAGSAMGRIAAMIGGIQAEKTPLERRMEVFGGHVAKAVFALAAAVTAGGVLVEGWARIGHSFLFAVALAVAAVPEGMPAVLTLTLALGVERMSKRKAVVRRLSAVEALGSITVVATDKTGTLTENRMTVKRVDSPDPERALLAMVLANEAEAGSAAGNPLEVALIEYAAAHGQDVNQARAANPRRSSLPFDSSHKFMRVTVDERGGAVSYLKGAPEIVLARCNLSESERNQWTAKAEGYAREGFRLLALGWAEGETDTGLTFLGLVLIWDPPRVEVPNAIRQAQEAGIRVIMITGDHPATALAAAQAIGMPSGGVLTGRDLEETSPTALRDAVNNVNIFARVTPEHKLKIVEALKDNGDVVAVTGDGVNDAPALKRADVGVAMGQRGSDVSREVASLVLLDDNFTSIVAAIEEGRGIYENIQKFIRFLFSTNLALILLVAGGMIGAYFMKIFDETGGLLLPLTALQLLWINIITNGPPALALAFDRNPDVMERKPRAPTAPLLDRESVRFVILTGVFKALMGCLFLIVFLHFGYSSLEARSALFCYEPLAQLAFVYPSRRISSGRPPGNLALHMIVGLEMMLQISTVLVPGLRSVLGLHSLDGRAFAIVAIAFVISWTGAEVIGRISAARRDV